ncbi:MAG: LPS-assembly protein LptD [Verrucomicrobia bacterium]|nr:LPS-assembly protein LptD [Verrucomicrobiota bacterium]
MRFVLLTLLAVCCSCLAAAPAAPTGFDLSADVSETDLAAGETIRRGNARLVDGTTSLTADEIRYAYRTQVARARGNVVFQRDGRRLLADELVYRRADQSFEVSQPRLGTDLVYLSGTRIHGTASEIIVEQAVATFGEPGPWTPTLRADRLLLRPDDRLQLTGGRVGLGRGPQLPLPSFPLPADRAFIRYATLAAGYRRTVGAFADVGLQFPVAPGLEAGGSLGLYTNRGLLAGPLATYASRTSSGAMQGSFQSGFIRDSGNRERDILDRPIGAERGFLEWRHRQREGENLTLTAQVVHWSDSEVLRDFRPDRFEGAQHPDSFLAATYIAPTFGLEAFARPNFNRTFLVQERLPELTATLLPQSLGSPALGLQQRGHASYVRLREADPRHRLPTLRSDRLDAYYGLSRTTVPASGFAFTPVAGVRHTRYGGISPATGPSSIQRTLTEVGFDAAVSAQATFPYRNEAWNVDGLRHRVTPRLSYRRIDRAGGNRTAPPAIDRRDFSTYLQPLGLGDSRAVDQLAPRDTLRLGVDNVLQTRDRTYGSRDLASLDLAADLRFDNPAGTRALSDLHLGLGLTPFDWLRFDLYQRLTTDRAELAELNTGLTLTNSEWWTLRVGTHFLRSRIEEYVVDAGYRLNEVYEGFTRLHYDTRQARFVERTFGIRQTLDRLWVLGYGVNFFEGRKREGSFGFVVQFERARF